MPLYDVILVGFPHGPKIAATPAEALAEVFRIPVDAAAQLAASAPTVVRSAVPEEVARKYFNAFAYIGAVCEFRLAEPAPEAHPDRAEPGPSGPLPATAIGPDPPRLQSVNAGRSVPPTGDFPVVDGLDDSLPELMPEPEPTSEPRHVSALEAPDAGGSGFSDLPGSAGWSDADVLHEAAAFIPEPDDRDAGPTYPTLAQPMADVPDSEEGRPSVAQIRAAWEAGRDISLPGTGAPGAASLEPPEPSAFDAWDPWMESGIPEADFPSGVALASDGAPPPRAPDGDEGTRLEAPHHSELLAALEARGTGPKAAVTSDPHVTPDDPGRSQSMRSAQPLASGRGRSASASVPTTPDGASPFGAPLGVSRPPEEPVIEDSEPKVDAPPAAPSPRRTESVEVPRGVRFVRVQGGTAGTKRDDET